MLHKGIFLNTLLDLSIFYLNILESSHIDLMVMLAVALGSVISEGQERYYNQYDSGRNLKDLVVNNFEQTIRNCLCWC